MIKPRHLRTKTSERRADRSAQCAEGAGDCNHFPGEIDAYAAHFIDPNVQDPKL